MDATETTPPEPDTTIAVGDYVRSFDFPRPDGSGRDLTGDRACYVEGTVSMIGEIDGCNRYLIHVSRCVFGGKEIPKTQREPYVNPPVNGTLKLFGGICNGVEKAQPPVPPVA